MRKAECLAWPPCKRPDQVAVRNREDYRHRKPYLSYQVRAQLIMSEGHDVLNLDIFDGYRLKGRYFADRETNAHAALITGTGEWTRCILQNVVNSCAGKQRNYNEYAGYYGLDYEQWVYASKEDEARVNWYFRSRPEGKYSLQCWESDLQRSKRIKQLENKWARINNMLDTLLPHVPEDFYRWIHEDVFSRKYLFQRKNKEKGTVSCACGACKRRWWQRKAIGIGKKACPQCGAMVQGTYRNEETAREALFLLQPCRDRQAWAERTFMAECTFRPGKETFVKLDEQIRIIIGRDRTWGDCYYEDGIDRDGRPLYWDSNHHSLRHREGYLYPGTLEDCRELWPEGLRNAGLPILAGKMVKANYNNIITTWHKKDWFEYLVKGGFHELVREISASMYCDRIGYLNDAGRNAQEVLRLDKGRIDRFRVTNGSFRALKWLQYEKSLGQKISQENLTYLSSRFYPDTNQVWETLSFVRSANVFANYVRKQAKLMKEIPSFAVHTWADYLDMAAKQGLNLSHEMFYKPKDLKAAHDACVREMHMAEGRKRADEILKKFPDVEKVMESVRDKYDYTGKDFCILVPDGIPDIIHEGRALGHCIDSTDRYFDRINQRISFLVFLRRAAEPTVPWYTLEIEPGGAIRQQRTTGNNQNKADVAAYTPFIREWQAEVRKRLTQSDRELAEASRNIRIEEYRQLREANEKVWHGKLAGQLLADVLEADLIENIG